MQKVLIAVLLQRGKIKYWTTVAYFPQTKTARLIGSFKNSELPKQYIYLSKQDILEVKQAVRDLVGCEPLHYQFNEAVCSCCGMPNPAYTTDWQDSVCIDCASIDESDF